MLLNIFLWSKAYFLEELDPETAKKYPEPVKTNRFPILPAAAYQWDIKTFYRFELAVLALLADWNIPVVFV